MLQAAAHAIHFKSILNIGEGQGEHQAEVMSEAIIAFLSRLPG
jgi:hypothetical protein